MIRVIKRYESRKLYDTEESRYVALEDLGRWVREGQQVQVLDNATGDDVTAQVLTQIILDEGKRGTSFLPIDLLHDLVRVGERAVASGVEQVQERVDRVVQASIDRLTPVRRAREEMAQLRQRLGELERTLVSLEHETVTRRPAASLPPPALPPSAPRRARRPAAARRPARKPAAKKPAPGD